jgi:hypothetical protein
MESIFMTTAITIEALLFSLTKITWGLLVHPYQTMQSLLREKRFVWLVLLPSLVLFITKGIWMVLIVPVVQTIFSCSTGFFFGCSLIPFLANWLTYFCVIWQIMLLYLLVRFARAFAIWY